MASAESEVVLLVADISGYTRFMLANRRSALHGQGIITELLEAVLGEVRLPLEVAKLEGDAVFMVAERTPASDWPVAAREMGARLEAFVAAFNLRLGHLMALLACPCDACRNLDKLRLKVIGHAGRAIRHPVGRHEEWTGLDVILVHRLLKNDIPADSYLLLTEPAFSLLDPPEGGRFSALHQTVPDLGTLALRVKTLEPAPTGRPQAGWRRRLGTLIREVRWRLAARG